jgi:hypothetical protein
LRQREPRRADSRAKVDGVFARSSARCRGQQDGVMAYAVTAQRLAQAQPAIEHRIVRCLHKPAA